MDAMVEPWHDERGEPIGFGVPINLDFPVGVAAVERFEKILMRDGEGIDLTNRS